MKLFGSTKNKTTKDKNVKNEFSFIKVWFTAQNFKPL